MTRWGLGLAAMVLVFAGFAWAQETRLDQAAARKVFFGIDMSGVLEGAGLVWRECITPKGETTYWFAGEVLKGRLEVRQDGALCFRYAETNYQNEACYFAYAQGRGQYRFHPADGDGGVFATATTRRVRACPARDTPVS